MCISLTSTISLASLSVFCILVAEYVARWIRNQPIERNAASNDSVSDSATIYESSGRDIVYTTKPLVIAVCLETALLYIRYDIYHLFISSRLINVVYASIQCYIPDD